MESNTQQALNFIKTNNYTEIKAGKERTTFLEIWMVVVDNRIFARSWGFAERSWYNTFLLDPYGQIKCGETIYNIQAAIPNDMNALTTSINQAYIDKYNFGKNIEYVSGIIQQNHIDKTIEFIVL
ncbi:MAG: DUF2255 family protein [Chitinophagales bacterium]|nr:DUF2255 family protein [Bacteroidota bacterium]